MRDPDQYRIIGQLNQLHMAKEVDKLSDKCPLEEVFRDRRHWMRYHFIAILAATAAYLLFLFFFDEFTRLKGTPYYVGKYSPVGFIAGILWRCREVINRRYGPALKYGNELQNKRAADVLAERKKERKSLTPQSPPKLRVAFKNDKPGSDNGRTG